MYCVYKGRFMEPIRWLESSVHSCMHECWRCGRFRWYFLGEVRAEWLSIIGRDHSVDAVYGPVEKT